MRQVIAANIRAQLEKSSTINSANTLARKTGLSQSHISKVLRCEAAFSTDIIGVISSAFGIQPWELLVDTEATRESFIRRIVYAQPIPDEVGDNHVYRLPTAEARPRKGVAHSRRKKGPAGDKGART